MAIDKALTRERIEAMSTEMRQAWGFADAKKRASIVERTVRMRADIRQIFTDVEHWNDHVRTANQPRIDPDPDGLLALILQKYDEQLRVWVS